MISAHRDTHFRFLRALAIGDALIVELPAGQRFHYRVREAFVADQRDLKLPRLPAGADVDARHLLSVRRGEPGGPLRYVVVATADAGTM